MTKTSFLPDVNVWIAMTFDSHVHHHTAKTWFDGLTDELLFFCRTTQQGFLRLATNPKVVGSGVLTLTEAWQKYDTFLNDPRIQLAVEPVNIEPSWRGFSQGSTFTPNIWNDAYLACVAGDYVLVTFDKGFGRYPGLKHSASICVPGRPPFFCEEP